MSDSFGEGLEQCAAAYLAWADDMCVRFPQTLFETCSSGGMRMDYQTLAHFSVVSTSDQTHYDKYPYIAGNVLSAVKHTALPCFPNGFTQFEAHCVASGFTSGDKLYLAVWNLSEDNLTRTIQVGKQYSSVTCTYPKDNKLSFELFDGTLTVHFTQKNQARFFELKR